MGASYGHAPTQAAIIKVGKAQGYQYAAIVKVGKAKPFQDLVVK